MKFLAALCLICLSLVPARGQELMPINLTTEYRANPMGIGEELPRLAWLLQSSAIHVRGQTQTAYEIRVASSLAMLAHGKGNLWESGKVLSAKTTQIEYCGYPLASGQMCWWQVRVWNGANEPGPWSEPATWSTGLLERADWKADWIGIDNAAAGRIPPTNLVGCQWVWTDENITSMVPRTRYFRGHFVVPMGRKVASAFLAMTASQEFTAWVNGHQVLHGSDRQTLDCSDVAFALMNGENVIAVRAENNGNYPALAGRMEIRFTQGAPIFVDVDSRWKSTAKEFRGWQSPMFEDQIWKHVKTLGPVGRQPWGQPTQVNLPVDPAVYLRREFILKKRIARATLYVTALGDYEFHLNGQCVSPDQLTPPFSDYRKRVYYQTYDVTNQIQLGHNTLGVVLTDGWYAGYWASTHRSHNYGGEPRVLAQLEIDYPDGTSVAVCTDDKWRASLGAIRQDVAMGGSVVDDREDLGDWDAVRYRMDEDWMRPKIGLSVPEPMIEADAGLPERAQERFVGSVREGELPGMYDVAFSQPLSGHVRVHGFAKCGQMIEVRYATAIKPDGRLVSAGNADTDSYVAGETGDFTFEPRHSRHDFQYVEISGLSKEPDASQVEAVAVYPDAPQTGWFTSNSELLNQKALESLWIERTHMADGPGRHFLAAAVGAYDQNLAPLYYRLLDTLSDESHIAGGGVISASSPLDHDPMLREGGQDAEPIVLWELLRMYGDQRIVRRHFAELADYMHDLQQHWQDYAHHDRFFSDGPNGNTEDAEMVTLAYAAHVADLMSQMSSQLGNTANAEDYRRMSEDLTREFQDRYLNIGTRSGIHTQTGYALALEWGLIPDESRTNAGDQLQRRVDREHGEIAMGNLGRSQLLFALSDAGHSDAAYQLLTENSSVGPWDSRWLYEDVAGIAPAAFGFSHIRIAPKVTDKLQSAGAVYDSTVGRIVCKWQRDENGIHLSVIVPINCSAELDMPTTNAGSVRESDQSTEGAPGIKSIGTRNGAAVYELQSGNYEFSAAP